jgi:hypothetical protein
MNLLLVILIVVPATGAAGGDELRKILDKHLETLGGRDAIAAIKSVAAYSSIEFMGLSGKAISVVKFPGKYYTRLELGAIVEEKGFDGLTAWTTDANGVTRRDIPEELKPMINELYLSSFSYLLSGRIPGRVEYLKDTLIEAENYHHLAMYPEGGDSIYVFINIATGRLEYRSESITGIKAITSYSDFRKVNGVETPFASQIETPGAPYDIAGWVDSVMVNPDIPDALFLMPGEAVIDFKFPVGADSSVIPVEIKSNSLFAEVIVNGRGPFKFLLDTGASKTIVSRRLADELGVEAIGEIPARGVGGYGGMHFGSIDSLMIGDISWYLKRIMIFDFNSMTGGRMSSIDGILGYDFFARFPLLINFNDAGMTLYNPASAKASVPGEPLEIEIYCQIPVVEVLLDGYPARLAVDLGAQMGLVIQGHSRWYREMAESIEKISSTTDIQGVGGIHEVGIVKLDSVNIGNIKIRNPSVMVSEDFAGMPFPEYIEGFLGLEILKRYNLILDYPSNKIYLEKQIRGNK